MVLIFENVFFFIYTNAYESVRYPPLTPTVHPFTTTIFPFPSPNTRIVVIVRFETRD